MNIKNNISGKYVLHKKKTNTDQLLLFLQVVNWRHGRGHHYGTIYTITTADAYVVPGGDRRSNVVVLG